ncbi:hypothetical protein DFH07DRAFT_774172 [Mycena maculata]|uniref:Uncharacterized protein n=1 Tax=Mycena maculata TaxID=230809 RepID=A0AAD7IYT0_9AGAR|nr:hypothetical protein DFH07DRAFT_774172 [Mycena maculata]
MDWISREVTLYINFVSIFVAPPHHVPIFDRGRGTGEETQTLLGSHCRSWTGRINRSHSRAKIADQVGPSQLNHLDTERNQGASRCQKFRVEESTEQTPETAKAIHLTAWRRRSIHVTDEEKSLIRLMAFAPSVTPINSDPSDAWQNLNNYIADSCRIMLVAGVPPYGNILQKLHDPSFTVISVIPIMYRFSSPVH